MKLKKIIVISLLFILFMSNIILAESQMKIDANKQNLQKNEEVSFSIQIANTSIAACTLEIYFNSNMLEYISGPENANYSNGRIIAVWFSESGQDVNNLEIGKFILKGKENGLANIVALGEFYNAEGESVTIDNNNIELQIGEMQSKINNEEIAKQIETQASPNNANLKVLRLNQEGVIPNFQKDIKEYYLVVDNTIQTLEVTALPENPNATVTIIGNNSLSIGKNIIEIKVASEDKQKEEIYKIFVYKTNNKEAANTNLETLAIRQAMLYPSFDNTVINYEAEIPYETDKIDILAIPEKENTKVTIEGNNAMQIGNNTILINVLAEDGITSRTYQIVVHRRNKEEQIQYEEETKVEAEKLSTILEDQEENNKKEEIQQDSKNKNVIFWIFGIIILGIIVLIIAYVVKKEKRDK